MRKAILVLAVVLVLVGVFAVSALTQVTIDRDIRVSVASDIDPDVAIKFEIGDEYGNVAYLTDDNYIEFDLSGALNNAGHFNTEALFHIGSAANWVFSITNNSNTGITVGISPGAYLTLAGENTVGVGNTEEYYFVLNTSGAMVGEDNVPIEINETLQIRKQ